MFKKLFLIACISFNMYAVHNFNNLSVERMQLVESAVKNDNNKQLLGLLALQKQHNNIFPSQHVNYPLPGGGVAGANAGFWTGKFAVHLAAQGTYLLIAGGVSLVATPATGLAVYNALQYTCAPVVEASSNAVGLSLGLATGVATGPV